MAGDNTLSVVFKAIKQFFSDVARFFRDLDLPHALPYFFWMTVRTLLDGLHAVWIGLLKGLVILGRATFFFTFVMFCFVATVLVLVWVSMGISALLVCTRRWLQRLQSNRIRHAMDHDSTIVPVWVGSLRPHDERPLNPRVQYQHEFPSDWLRTFQEIRREPILYPVGSSSQGRGTPFSGNAGELHGDSSRNPVHFVWSAFSKWERALEEFHDCVICLDDADGTCGRLGRLECGHIFHRECIAQWFRSKQEPSCPSCRKAFPIPDSASSLSYGTV